MTTKRPPPPPPPPDSEVATASKTLDNSNVKHAQSQVPDLAVVGDGDAWKLLSKASSKKEGWMKSTKAYPIPGLGCLVQVTTQQGTNVAEAVTFVPGAQLIMNSAGQRRLVAAGSSPTSWPDDAGANP